MNRALKTLLHRIFAEVKRFNEYYLFNTVAAFSLIDKDQHVFCHKFLPFRLL